MKTILVPTDFSDNATNALYYAAALARQVGGKIIMVHVINLPVMPLENGVTLRPIAQLEEDYNQSLIKLSKELRLENGFRVKVETKCLYGSSLAILNDLIKNESVDLVVMGTKGATNFLDKLIGSNTSGFIKEAICPVLAVPADAKFTSLKHIVYASDFKSEEKVFLQQLFWLANSFGSRVSIVNILTERPIIIDRDNQVIREITKQITTENYSIAQMQKEDIVEGLHQFVEENQADLLAISIHERNFINQIFHKSISEKLIYHTTTPLLALPEKPYSELLSRIKKYKSIPVK